MWLHRNLGSETEKLTILYSVKGYLREESLLSKLCQLMENKVEYLHKSANKWIYYLLWII